MLRFFAALTPAIALFSLHNPLFVLMAFIVLGQGHFLLTYLYQWRAKKITRVYIFSYLIIAPILFSLVSVISYSLVLIITATIFAVHYFYDEARIMVGSEQNVSLTLLLPPIFAFISYLLFAEFSIDIFNFMACLAIIIYGMNILFYNYNTIFQTHVLVLNCVGILIGLIYYFGIPVSASQLLGAIIIHHYATWYIFQYFKLRIKKEYLSQYIHDVLTVNFILIALFFLYYYKPSFSALGFMFEPVYFYVWTLLHIIFTSQTLAASIKSRASFLFKSKLV